MKPSTRIRLRSFNGTSAPSNPADAGEDYWRLIGRTGQVVQSPEDQARFATTGPDARACVCFDDDLKALGLEAHNPIPNSLWIRCSDLDAI